jgi:hypothetical protein
MSDIGYYPVKIIRIDPKKLGFNNVRQWCVDNIGRSAWSLYTLGKTGNWYMDYNEHTIIFTFAYEDDATLFALTWK